MGFKILKKLVLSKIQKLINKIAQQNSVLFTIKMSNGKLIILQAQK